MRTTILLTLLFVATTHADPTERMLHYLVTVRGVVDATREDFSFEKNGDVIATNPRTWNAEKLGTIVPLSDTTNDVAAAEWTQAQLDTGPTSQAMFKTLKAKLLANFSITVTNLADLVVKLDAIKAAFESQLDDDAAALQAANTLGPYRTANNTALLHLRQQNEIRDLLIGLGVRKAEGK